MSTSQASCDSGRWLAMMITDVAQGDRYITESLSDHGNTVRGLTATKPSESSRGHGDRSEHAPRVLNSCRDTAESPPLGWISIQQTLAIHANIHSWQFVSLFMSMGRPLSHVCGEFRSNRFWPSKLIKRREFSLTIPRRKRTLSLSYAPWTQAINEFLDKELIIIYC
jgi:hypothetical protein